MMNTAPCKLSPLYDRRIKGLHDDKMEINKKKLEHYGHYSTDDHGFIYDPNFTFSFKSEREDGIVRGFRQIGAAMHGFIDATPAYVNKHSALAGAWYETITRFVPIEFAPEDYPDKEVVETWEKYHPLPGFTGMNHCAPDMKIGFQLGWGGLKKKLEYYRDFNNPADTAFYDGSIELVEATQAWVARLAGKAFAMAEEETDPDDKQNLLEIANMNAWLVENPPRNMREAIQFTAHFQTIDRMYFTGGALDQIDELFRPFYEKETKAGTLTDEEVVWYIASLFFNDTHYSQIAGLTPDGSRDMTSRMSFLVLDAMHYLHIPINMALRVHDGVNDTLLRRSLEYTLMDGSGVDYSLNIGCEKGYAKMGYPEELGRMRAKVGCNWTAIPGYEYPLQDVTRANLAWPLYYALQDAKAGERSLDYLWERYCYHTEKVVDSIKMGYDRHYEVKYRNRPEIVSNLFMHGPVERGLDCSQGGVDIMNLNIDGIGLTTVADSIAAIEQRIVGEGRITWDELFEALDANWEGYENIRLMMKNISRFGAPDSPAEKWAIKIRDHYVHACRDKNTPKHNIPINPGMFSHGEVYTFGRDLPATPNGRFFNDPICHSNEPDPGFAQGLNTFSPSLKATAVGKVQPGYGNSSPLHLDIDSDMLKGEAGIDALVALIHTHNHMGGTLINLNCLTKQTLMEAHEDPTTHPDLVVRVTGYSAFFISLSKEYRQQIVDRFLSKQ
ncbi:MAG: pyruvate-formate lyase [Clostridia bacterium]|nr:pyruvate-formate lyase [Clostridia bacterium]